MKRTLLRIVLPLAFAAFFLWRFLAGLDLAEVGRVIAAVHPLPLAAGVAIAGFVLFLRAWRWRRLVRGVGDLPLRSAYHATAIGFAASVVLPARAGEVIRPILAARERKLPVSGLLASVLVERLLDLAAILVFFLFSVFAPEGLTADPASRANMTRAAFLSLGALVALVAGLVLLAILGRRLVHLTLGRARFIPENLRHKLEIFAIHCLDGLAAFRAPGNALVVLGQTFLIWLVIDLQVACNFAAFGFHLPFRATFVVVALGALGLLVPTPGGVGSFHRTTQIAVGLYGVPPAAAAGFAVVHHLACFVPLLVLGTISLVATGIGWGSVRELAAEGEKEAETADESSEEAAGAER